MTDSPSMESNYRVVLVHKERCLVRRGEEELYCVLAGSLRYRDEIPVVGDYVEVTVNPYGDSLIRSILPRRTVFCRPDRGGHADGFVKTLQVQPLVANIDYVFIITSLNNDFSVSRIARYAARNLSLCVSGTLIAARADDRDARIIARALGANCRVFRVNIPGETVPEMETICENGLKRAITDFLRGEELSKDLAQNPEMCIIYG